MNNNCFEVQIPDRSELEEIEKDMESLDEVKIDTDDCEDSVRLYFKMISKYDLLTKEEEIELGNIIQHSNDETEVAAATNKLINANLRLVVSIAKKYSGLELMKDFSD